MSNILNEAKRMKGFKKIIVSISAVCVASALLSGCSTIKQTQEASKAGYDKTNKIMKQVTARQPRSLVSFQDTYYLSNTPFKVNRNVQKLPPVFHQNITYTSTQGEPLNEVLFDITKTSGVDLRLTEDAVNYLLGIDNNKQQSSQKNSGASQEQRLQNITLSLQYDGQLINLIDSIASRFDLYWKYDKATNQVNFYHYETKTFPLDLIPGYTEMKTQIGSSSQTSGINGNASMQTQYDSSQNDPWKASMNTITMMLAKGGSVQVSPSTGFLTVTTTPPSLAKISNYINEVNNAAKKKIAIRIDVYDVSQSHSSNYGLNWNLLYKVTQGSISWNTGNIPNALASPFSSVETATATGSIDHGPFSGSQIIGNALQQLGSTSHITGTTVYTVNGRPAPIQVSRSTAYVKQVSVTTLGTGNSGSSDNNNVEVSATPGTVNTGYSITVTPKIIQGNQVVVNMSVNIASLLALREQKFGPKDAQNTIELPDLRNKAFMEAVPLKSGQTAVLAGFQNNVNDTGTNSVGPESTWLLGGNQATDHEDTITVVVVTPYIVGN